MANYYEYARTNHFHVADKDAFINAMDNYAGINLYWNSITGTVCILATDDYGFPSEDNDGNELDFIGVVSQHLADESVAIFMGVGQEKLRYLVGYAIAVNNKGETRGINLSNIYELAKDLGTHITKAEY